MMMNTTSRLMFDSTCDVSNLTNKSWLMYFGLPDSPILSIDDEKKEEIISTTELKVDSEKPTKIIYETFFSQMPQKASIFNHVPFEQIQSELFLQICEDYADIVVKFNNPIFIPLQADINGNINKLRQKLNQNPMRFQTLYGMINEEIDNQTTNARNSTTDALLWLNRAFEFLARLIYEFGQGDKTLLDAATKAYEQSLKRYHGILARRIFSFALHAVPKKGDFLRSLTVHPNDASKIDCEKQLCNEMIEHASDMLSLLQKITSFYVQHGLVDSE